MSKIKCTWCGEALSEDELECPRKDSSDEVICDDCYHVEYEYICPLCENGVEIEGNQEHLFVSNPLAKDQEISPGIYHIVSLPWYSSDYFSITIFPRSLKRVAPLPARLTNEVEGDYICEDCAKKYSPHNPTKH